MSVSFHCAEIKFKLPHKKELKQFVAAQVKLACGKKAKFTYVFCSDEYLLQINRQFLNHDFYTDIITFPLNETEREIEAEIYISLDRVRENAEKFGVDGKVKGKASSPDLLPGMEKGVKKTLAVSQKGKGNTDTHPASLDREEERQVFERELERVIFHGALHLVGYQDKTKKEQAEMRRMEEEWVGRYRVGG